MPINWEIYNLGITNSEKLLMTALLCLKIVSLTTNKGAGDPTTVPNISYEQILENRKLWCLVEYSLIIPAGFNKVLIYY